MKKIEKFWPRVGFMVFSVVIVVVLWMLNQNVLNMRPFDNQSSSATLLPTFSFVVESDEFTPTPENQVDAQSTPVEIVEEIAQTVEEMPNPDGFALEAVMAGFQQPIAITNAGDGSGRLFIAELSGKIWVITPDYQVIAPVFLNLSDRVGDVATEQGLLGLAFDPAYEENGYFYVNYIDNSGNTILARFRVSADPNIADLATEIRILEVRQPYANHNGGGMQFGPDGYLYAGLGDGGLANDPLGAGQRWDTYLGKILRIDVRNEETWTPVDNPNIDPDYPLNWAIGLRNPWQFSFDARTGDLYIGDVGQNEYEEIHWLSASDPYFEKGGANFGWSYYEGFHPFAEEIPKDIDFIDPIHEYGHDWGCSVTGGVVYRGADLPEFSGVYLYGDYCFGIVWGLLRNADGDWVNQELFRTVTNITSFGQSEDLALYYVDLGGTLYKLVRK